MMRLPAFFLLAVILSQSLMALAAVPSCDKAHLKSPPPDILKLLDFQNLEVQNLSASQVRKLNDQDLQKLEAEIPQPQPLRASRISYSEAWDALESITRHPTLNFDTVKAYNHEDREIGYCFGRALYYHLLLLRMGLQKESIKKIWVVGPMSATSRKDEKIIWAYHVATMVYVSEKGWTVLDPNIIKPISARAWAQTYLSRSIDQKARIYVTRPEKMNADLGPYSREQLGLDLPREEDWFRGYFQDLMRSLQTLSLQDLGVKALPRNGATVAQPETAAKSPPEMSPLRKMLDFVWH